MADTQAHALLGWGYEGRTTEDLLTFVSAHGITSVVDVRLTPISRKKGFSKSALSEALTVKSVNYLHLRDLGNPRDNRPGFTAPGTPAALDAHTRFRAEVLASEAARSALRSVHELLERGPVLLLCFEANPACCHRSLIREAIEQTEALV